MQNELLIQLHMNSLAKSTIATHIQYESQ